MEEEKIQQKEFPSLVLKSIEGDIKKLILKSGKMEHDLHEQKEKYEADIKSMLLEFIDCIDAYKNTYRPKSNLPANKKMNLKGAITRRGL